MLEIIAEVGINHNGDLQLAEGLISDAKEAGATCVKFQTFFVNELARRHTPKSEFQKRDKTSENHIDMLRRCELSLSDHMHLKKFSENIGLEFLSTPYHPSAVKLLEEIGVTRYKVASADLRDVYLMDAIMETQKKIILSTGMASQKEVTLALEYILNNKNYDESKVTVLHCTSDYPCIDVDANLNFIRFISELKVRVGFSDHSIGSKQALIALGLGARVFEKHFTHNKKAAGPDHVASCEKEELKEYVADLNSGYLALGSMQKSTLASEASMKITSQKSLVYSKDFNAGVFVEKDQMEAMRPLDGIPAHQFEKFIGKKLKKAVKRHANVQVDDFE